MAVKAIAHSYWRRIKTGSRTFDTVPDSVKDDVRTLAKMEVADGVITEDVYETLIGEAYQGE